jgi:hypothetical protein
MTGNSSAGSAGNFICIPHDSPAHPALDRRAAVGLSTGRGSALSGTVSGGELGCVNQLAEPPGWLESLISRQHGLVARAQVLACGKSRAWLDNEVRRGRWQRVLPRV